MYKIIDSHQHFWQLSRGDYGWLTPDLQPLYRDFLPADLEPYLTQKNIHGTILVQAAPTIDETYFLLELATHYSFILGVVGWVDMEARDAAAQIERLAEHPKFCGVRPMIQDITDVDWMLRHEVALSLKKLTALHLTFDALVLPAHLPNLIQLLSAHPELKVVIDHGAKPLIKENSREPWASHMKSLAAFPNVHCKLSGLLTEAASPATWHQIEPYVQHLFSCFGYQRIMWGSDFPVLQLMGHYPDWFDWCYDYVKTLGQEACAAVFGDVAAGFYLRS